MFLCGNNRAVPATWKSKESERVTKSPMASETMAISCRISRGKMTRDSKSVLQNRQQITRRTFKELRHNTRP